MLTSPTGTKQGGFNSLTKRPRSAGFSLIEVLIVMTLIVTMTALLAPILLPSPGRVLRASASEMATTLRETRRHAQAESRRKRFLVDTSEHRFGIADSALWKPLPEGMTVQLTTAQALITDENRGGIDFYPDGTSTGGRLVLGMAQQSVQIDVEWLTGRIRVLDPPQ